MTYEKARHYESILQDEFGEDSINATVTGGLPENPEEFDLTEAKEEFKENLGEDEDGTYDGPDPEGDPWIEVDAEILPEVAKFLKNTPEQNLSFDSLHLLGADHIAEKEQIVATYHLYSFQEDDWVILKVFVPEDEPVIPSLTDIYPGANWHEREAYDLMGIRFTDHPDLRRILLPNDWEGHPLRKDYTFPLYYRGLPVDWADARENRMSRDDFYEEAQELEEMDIDEEIGFTPKQHKKNGT
jgi:NADH-quinone oxidoreductase subunit C